MFEAHEARHANPNHEPVEMETGAPGAREPESAAAGLSEPDPYRALSDMQWLMNDARMVATDMRSLMYLFLPAVCHDGSDTQLTSATHLVIDCINSMAGRLENIERRATALYDPFRAPLPRSVNRADQGGAS